MKRRFFPKSFSRGNILQNKQGASTTEYGLLLGLIAVGLMVGVSTTGTEIDHVLSQTKNAVGGVVPNNAPPEAPTLAALSDQTISVNAGLGPIDLSIADNDTSLANLSVTATSSNPSLIANADITARFTSGQWQLTGTPVNNATGSSTITVTVSDGQTTDASQSFTLTVDITAQSCKDLLDSGVTASGTYQVKPSGGSAQTVYCDMTTNGGGWTVLVGNSTYNSASAFPFSPGLSGVSQNYANGRYTAYQGSSPSGHCHTPVPAYSVVIPFPHQELRLDGSARWHNATSYRFVWDYNNDGSYDRHGGHGCFGACSQGANYSYSFNTTYDSGAQLASSRFFMVGASCQNYGGSNSGYLNLRYLAVR